MSELALFGGKKAKNKAFPALAALRQQGSAGVERSAGKPRVVAHTGHEDPGIRTSVRAVSWSTSWHRSDQRNSGAGSRHGCSWHQPRVMKSSFRISLSSQPPAPCCSRMRYLCWLTLILKPIALIQS